MLRVKCVRLANCLTWSHTQPCFHHDVCVSELFLKNKKQAKSKKLVKNLFCWLYGRMSLSHYRLCTAARKNCKYPKCDNLMTRVYDNEIYNANICIFLNLTNQIYYLPFVRFLGNLEFLVLPEDDIPLSLIESCAEDALPVASLSRIMLSYPLLPPLW